MAVQRNLQSLLKSFRPVGKAENVHSVASSDRINALQDAVKFLARGDHINTGSNIRKRVGQDGFLMLTVDQKKTFSSGSTVSHFPWEIRVSTNPDTNLPTVKVLPGTVNNMIPTNMFDNFDISDTGTWYIVLDIITDGDSPTDVSINQIQIPPDVIGSNMEIAPTSFSILLGVVVDKVPFQIIYQLINIQPQVTILSLKDTPVPGQPFYDINYTWIVNLL